MTQPNNDTIEPDVALREAVLARAKVITAEFVNRFAIAHDELEAGRHRAALGALDGAENEFQNFRTLLRLLEPERPHNPKRN